MAIPNSLKNSVVIYGLPAGGVVTNRNHQHKFLWPLLVLSPTEIIGNKFEGENTCKERGTV
jgi:hypothetical protein